LTSLPSLLLEYTSAVEQFIRSAPLAMVFNGSILCRVFHNMSRIFYSPQASAKALKLRS
jgi:hypothetical protein